jgi:hypothetical protein
MVKLKLCAGGADLPKKVSFRVINKHTRTGQIGPPKGSSNAMVHGAFARISHRNMDQRYWSSKAMRQIEAELVSHVGGDPSAAEVILIERATYLTIKCLLFEAKGFSEDSQSVDEKYLAWQNSLRLTLQSLGLQRRARDITDLIKAMAVEAGRHEQ